MITLVLESTPDSWVWVLRCARSGRKTRGPAFYKRILIEIGALQNKQTIPLPFSPTTHHLFYVSELGSVSLGDPSLARETHTQNTGTQVGTREPRPHDLLNLIQGG